MYAAPPRGVSTRWWRLRARHPGVCARMSVCARVLDEGPGTARRSRPVPFRSVEYRAARHPLSTAVSASTPARLPASVPPHAEPFALRSDQGALLCLPAGYPARIRSLSSAPHFSLVTHGRLPPVFLSHSRRRSFSLTLRSVLSFSLEIFSLSARRFFASHSVPSGHSLRSSLGSRVTLGERTSTGYRSLRLPSPPAHSPSRSPFHVSFVLPPSPSGQPVCLSLFLSPTCLASRQAVPSAQLYAPSTLCSRRGCLCLAAAGSCSTSPSSAPLSFIRLASLPLTRE